MLLQLMVIILISHHNVVVSVDLGLGPLTSAL
jgi:hypothetical protein